LNSCVLAAVLIGTAAIAGGAVYYINGNYIIEVPRDMRSVYNATIKTIQSNNQYFLLNQSYSKNSASVSAAHGKQNISIDLSSTSGKSTEIKIRIGALGNENDSIALANQITKNLT
jgi:hypothetical protein